MKQPHEVLNGVSDLCFREAEEVDLEARESLAHGHVFDHARQQAQASTFRRIGRELRRAADEMRPSTEEHEWDCTVADLVDAEWVT